MRSSIVFLAALAVACTSSRRDRDDEDACGGCPAGEVCNDRRGECEPCTASCDGKVCGDDGCGGSCGDCASGMACRAGACEACLAKTCADLGASCGSADDGCGGTLSCGACGAGLQCVGGRCVDACEPGTCASLGKNCGLVDDDCGVSLNCGTCAGGLTCGGGGVANVCGSGTCTKRTCASAGANCGRISDGCGGFLECGTCRAPEACGAVTPNVCSCKPETDLAMCGRLGKDCGPLVAFDSCGASRSIASCGSCSAPATCGGGGTQNVCGCTTGEGDAQVCARHGKTCGTATLTDACGRTRTVSCGTCASPKTCGGSGTANVCGCPTRETDQQICTRLGKNCGQLDATDLCGDTRSVTCGTCSGGKTCGGAALANVCGGFELVAGFPGGDVRTIWAAAPTDVWVSCPSFSPNGVFRWNGSSWVTLDTLGWDALAGSASDNVWIAEGFFGTRHWNGTAWEDAGDPIATNERATALATTGPSSAWLATNGERLYTYVGLELSPSQWASQPNPSSEVVTAMWARTPTEIWAVGRNGVVMHSDGATWRLLPSPASVHLSAVHGTSATDVWVSGEGKRTYRWDGARWSEMLGTSHDSTSAMFVTTTDVWLTGPNSGVGRLHRATNEFDEVYPASNLGAITVVDGVVWTGGLRGSTGSGRLFRSLR